MSKLTSKRTLAVAAASLAVVTGGGAALAATSGSSPAASSFLEAVARHLGISTERLQEATKAAALEQVDTALEAGTITEAHADELRSRIEAGEGLFGGFHGPMHEGIGGKLTAAADYLELSVDQLHERLAGGQSLADVAEAEGKTVEGLKQAMLAEAERRLDEAVSDGRLTTDQAEAMRDGLESRIDDLVNGTFGGPRGGRVFVPRFSGGSPADAPSWGVPA